MNKERKKKVSSQYTHAHIDLEKKRTSRKFNVFRSGFAWHDAYTSIVTCLSRTSIFSIESMIDSSMHVSHHLFRLSFFYVSFFICLSFCFFYDLNEELNTTNNCSLVLAANNFVYYCHSLLRWWTYPGRF
jgi:hypothetical protein